MKVFLLIAGRSRRFWPLRDKTLLPICGKPLLLRQVDALRAAGQTDITIVAGAHNLARAHTLLPTIPAIEQKDLARGMQGALLDALPAAREEPVLIMSSNDVVPMEAIRAVVSSMEDTTADGAILAQRVAHYFPGGYLTIDGARVTDITEKPGAGNEPSDLMNIVVHAHRDPRALLTALHAATTDRDDGYERSLSTLFSRKRYRAVPWEGDWFPVKYPWQLLPLLASLLAREKRSIAESTMIHPTAVVEGNVVLEEGARVCPHATILGPCTIGSRTIIGSNTLVRGSSIGDDCVIGFGSEIKGGLLQDHVWTHMSYIGDSVIGANVSFGAGSVTGNLRLDEGEIHSASAQERIATGLRKFGTVVGDDSRIGIHTGINPGVKIGEGCFINSGTLVTEDVQNGSFVAMKEGKMDIRPNRVQPPSPDARQEFRGMI